MEDSKKNTDSNSLAEKERVEIFSERIRLLFGFCMELVPDIELLEKATKGAGEKEDMALSAAPLLGAAGLDYEQAHFDWKLRRKRAEALLNLVNVLVDTEKERNERKISKDGDDIQKIRKLFGV